LANLKGVQVVDGGERVELIETGRDAVVLDICQTADADDELRTPTLAGEVVAGAFDVAICEAQTLARLA
jgi:uncharacterized protein YqiB (DUF1249 family)